jgi:enoyl-CoA hydratase
MGYQTLEIVDDGSVRTITVNRPEVLNAQSRRMLEEFDEAMSRAAEDDAVRVIIVAGAGEHFSAGHDLGSKEQLADREARPEGTEYRHRYNGARTRMIEYTLHWRDLPKPTIARVQGYCIMGGLMLASAMDLIVASEDARFSDRAVRWGSAHVQYVSLPWDLGPRAAKEYLFTGDWLTAQEALRLGLVNRVVPRERLVEETMALAQRIALNDPFALRMAKFSVNQAQDEMGFRTSIQGTFQTYMLTSLQRDRPGAEAGDGPTGVERARARDRRFGDGAR